MTTATQSILLHDQVDADLAAHFAALGVSSVAGYKLWCHRHGLDKALDKTVEERAEELALFESLQPVVDPEASKLHDPQRAALIEKLFRGELEGEKLGDLLSRLRVVRDGLAGDEAAQEALRRLVLHVEKYGHLLRPMTVVKYLGQNNDNTYIAALGQLARHHRDWLRPIGDWRPETAKVRLQFQSLSRYLLAKYEVPVAMDAAWFMGHSEAAYEQQRWFKHVAGGQNLRTAGVPMTITKKMAHIFGNGWQSPQDTVIQALRTAQVQALGANSHFAWDLTRSPLGDSLEEEEFWISVIHFLVNNHPMLRQSYIRPIYDYIHYHKYRPQRITRPDGTEVEAPPPMPNFSMKGRSASKLVWQVDQWHEQLSGDEDVPLKTWPATGLADFKLEEYDEHLQHNLVWSVYELCTSQQLRTEGRVMGHCVFTYTDECLAGATSIWSIRVLNPDDEEGVEKHVLTIAVENRKGAVTQARGKFNMALNQKLQLEKQRRAGSLYVHLLRESGRVMRLWMDRAGLVWKAT